MLLTLITGISLASYSYLRKPSKFWTYHKTYDLHLGNERLTLENTVYPATQYRPWFDILVTTSLIYALAGLFSLYLLEHYLAYFSLVTWISSSLYHLYGEQLFFNFDNIFATTLLFIYVWSLISAYQFHSDPLHLTVASIGLPLAIFLLVYCGMPGDITILRDCLQCRRCQLGIYRPIHSLWHIATGLGICTAAWHFYQCRIGNTGSVSNHPVSYCPSYFYQGGQTVLGASCYFDQKLEFPVVPCVAFAGSFAFNLLGNWKGVMPLD